MHTVKMLEVKIELENCGMRSYGAIRKALRELADRMPENGHSGGGVIQDVNGNSVGKWSICQATPII